MSDSIRELLDYYTSPGITTDPGDYADLPTDVGGLCRVIQGVMIHIFWAERMGETLSEARKQEVNIRPASAMLQAIRAKNDASLTVERPLSQRLVGNCRDFSTLLCAMLRHQGIPARTRCGFGTYFMPGHYEDHWMVEYWHADDGRWVQVDPQLDAFQPVSYTHLRAHET